MKRLSVIIVTYKSERDIYDCIQSVWDHCDIDRSEVEVIVVDNSPECEPMFSSLSRRFGNDIILIHNERNGGYGQGNNVGIRRATAPVVMIMNPDVRLREGVFKAALDSFQADPSLCMYGMKQLQAEAVKSPLSFDCSRRMNGYLRPFVSSFCNRFDLYVPRWMYFAGACFFVRKEKFVEVGLFDEDIFMYGEEDDVHWRMLMRYGSHFHYNPRAHYIHLTLERKATVETEKKMVRSIVLSNQKKGIPREKTIRNFIRFYRTRLMSAAVKSLLRGKSPSQQVFRTMITELKAELSLPGKE